MKTARALSLHVLVLVLVSSVSCILIVSPDERGTQCRFRGETTECGQCLATRCRSQIDAACFDETVLAPAEQCAASGDEACNRVPASAIATCLQTQCTALCYARVGPSQTRCEESFVAPGLACSCSFSATNGNDRRCIQELYPRTRCCAPAGWPGPALQCECTPISCQPKGGGGCVCILSDNIDADTAEECRKAAGEHCCATRDRCECGPTTCTGGKREVEVCNKDQLTCPVNTTEFPGCSIPR